MSAPSRPLIVATFALLCAIWGSTWAAIQIGLEGIPPFSGVALRFGIAGALLLAAAWARGVRLGRSRRERWLWVVNGLLSFCGSYGIVYWAEQWVPSGLTSVLFATYPLFVAVLAHWMLPEESLSAGEVAGVLVGFAGVGAIFSEDLAALGGREVAVASAVMLGSPIVSAVASVAIKRWGQGIHPFSLTAVPMLLAAAVMGGLAAAVEREAEFRFTPAAVAALVYLAIAGSAVTFTLYYWLLERLPAKRLALIAYVIPVEAVLIGTLWRGEPFTARIGIGSALVIAGVAAAVHRRS